MNIFCDPLVPNAEEFRTHRVINEWLPKGTWMLEARCRNFLDISKEHYLPFARHRTHADACKGPIFNDVLSPIQDLRKDCAPNAEDFRRIVRRVINEWLHTWMLQACRNFLNISKKHYLPFARHTNHGRHTTHADPCKGPIFNDLQCPFLHPRSTERLCSVDALRGEEKRRGAMKFIHDNGGSISGALPYCFSAETKEYCRSCWRGN